MFRITAGSVGAYCDPKSLGRYCCFQDCTFRDVRVVNRFTELKVCVSSECFFVRQGPENLNTHSTTRASSLEYWRDLNCLSLFRSH